MANLYGQHRLKIWVIRGTRANELICVFKCNYTIYRSNGGTKQSKEKLTIGVITRGGIKRALAAVLYQLAHDPPVGSIRASRGLARAAGFDTDAFGNQYWRPRPENLLAPIVEPEIPEEPDDDPVDPE